jgi:CxxC-x17-CxxC domain-containing protein
MNFVDRQLTCIDCGAEFVFTAGEQLFFHEKQFTNDPKHCKQCKAKRNPGFRKPVRTETKAICAECGAETTVPFTPNSPWCKELNSRWSGIGSWHHDRFRVK